MKTKSKRPIHQVVRGDSMLKLRSIGDGEAQLVLADPPYGIAYQSRTGVTIANDKHPYIWWLNEAYRICADGGGLLCFTRWDVQDSFKLAIESAGFRIRSQIVWDKCVHGMGDCKAQFAPKHEVVWWATKGKFAFPGKRPMSVISVPRPGGKLRTHPTEKPVDLMQQLIEVTTNPRDLVVDPFAGTGSTGVACVKSNRRFYGVEMNGTYARKARQRMAAQRGSS